MKIIAFKRHNFGTRASRRLRSAGVIPAVIYGPGIESQMISVYHNIISHGLKKEIFNSSIFTLEVENKPQDVFLRDIQYHPFNKSILHIDFQNVVKNKKIRLKVPIKFLNKEINQEIKTSGMIISLLIKKIEIECFALDLPKFIEVNLLNIHVKKLLYAKDICLPNGVCLSTKIFMENPLIVSASIARKNVTTLTNTDDKNLE